MELYNGRPTDLTGREDREIRVYDLLDSLGIEYQRTDHGHADTMEACNEIDAVSSVCANAVNTHENASIKTIARDNTLFINFSS